MDILGIDIGTVSVKYLRIRGKGVIISHGDYPHKGGWEDLNFVLTDIKDKEGTDVEIAITNAVWELGMPPEPTSLVKSIFLLL